MSTLTQRSERVNMYDVSCAQKGLLSTLLLSLEPGSQGCKLWLCIKHRDARPSLHQSPRLYTARFQPIGRRSNASPLRRTSDGWTTRSVRVRVVVPPKAGKPASCTARRVLLLLRRLPLRRLALEFRRGERGPGRSALLRLLLHHIVVSRHMWGVRFRVWSVGFGV